MPVQGGCRPHTQHGDCVHCISAPVLSKENFIELVNACVVGASFVSYAKFAVSLESFEPIVFVDEVAPFCEIFDADGFCRGEIAMPAWVWILYLFRCSVYVRIFLCLAIKDTHGKNVVMYSDMLSEDNL